MRLKHLWERIQEDKKTGDKRVQNFDLDAAVKKIQAAVAAGTLTQKEADAKIKSLKEGALRRQEEMKRRKEIEREKPTDKGRRER